MLSSFFSLKTRLAAKTSISPTMHNRFDMFVKDVLREAFGELGMSQQEVEVSADAQRMDFYFAPIPRGASESPSANQDQTPESPESAASSGLPPIFVRMARTSCVIEHYHHPPGVDAVRSCLRKQLTWHHVKLKEAARDPGQPSPRGEGQSPSPVDGQSPPGSVPQSPPGSVPQSPPRRGARDSPPASHRSEPPGARAPGSPPIAVLWALSTGRPKEVMRGFAFRPLRKWPAGVYAGPLPAIPFRIVVLSELPEDRTTLPLRLLGRGATLRRAVRELMALPPEVWERQHILPLLVRLQVEIQDAETNTVLTEEEKEVLVTAQELVKNIQETAHRQGLEKGLEKGRQQGLELVKNIKETAQRQGQEKGLVQLFALKLARPISDEEQAVLRGRFDTIGPDRIGALLLQLPGDALAAWLADPNAQ